MDTNKPHITFPLDSFLQRLELADFAISPAQRMQLLRALQIFGQDHLRDLNGLKYRLCPIVARNEQEQLRFYELFDSYLQEIQTEEWIVEEPETPLNWWQKVPRWLWIVGLLGLLGAMIGINIYLSKPQQDDPVFSFVYPDQYASIGDTVYLENTSANFDSNQIAFQWLLIDNETGTMEDSSHAYDWELPIREQGDSPYKEVWMIVSDTSVLDTFTVPLVIRCLDLPKVEAIIGPTRAEVGDTVSFRLDMEQEEALTMEWSAEVDSLNDNWIEDIRNLDSAAYIFDKAGVYNIQAIVKRSGVEGECQVELAHRVIIGGDRAFLEETPLRRRERNGV